MTDQSSSNCQYRVMTDYEVNDPHPLILEDGSHVELVRRDSGWPGWVWVTDGQQSGWVPETHLEECGDGQARLLKDFNGKDLSARKGDILVARETVSGWIHATSPTGECGWFPLFNLRPAQQT
ncbi:MAG: SH3 domain-containing protein [Opitutales bacterium]|jgi:hypothetical protein